MATVPAADEAPVRGKCMTCLCQNVLTLATLAGVLAGVALGFILKASKSEWTEREISYVNFGGDLFLRMLRGLIIPLITASLISAIGAMDLSLSRKIGMLAIMYFLITTIIAVILGIILVSIIRPGVDSDAERTGEAPESARRPMVSADTLMDLVRNMFPPNLIQACIAQYRTTLQENNETHILLWKMGSDWDKNTNIIGLVVFSTVMGIALAQIGTKGVPLLTFFISLGETMMLITNWVIWFSPVGVMFLISAKIVEMSNFAGVMKQLGLYFGTVLIGLVFHGFFILPLFYFLFARANPFKYVLNMATPLVIAFGTASSMATLPFGIKALETKCGIDPRVARFVMPIGATINMNGTALYEAVAALFIAQIRNVGLTFGNIIAVSITATAASVGAAGIPQAGLVTMVMVLDTVGLPAEDISIILSVDWLLDRFRTVINVLGDAIGSGIVNRLSKNELEKLPPAAVV